jgi:aminoglycoside phosphotransferase (APT) family kinase protein
MAANMLVQKLHAGEVDIDGDLVARLIATQFPQWAGLTLQPVASAGTVHALYRLGDELVVRLPRLGVPDEEVAKEHAWLPRLAPRLPVAIPVPHGRGVPAEGYPYAWSVYSWLEGETPSAGDLSEPEGLARDLAAFIVALRGLSTEGAPTSSRGTRSLALLDAPTRRAIKAAQGLIDTAAATAAWEAALGTPEWRGPHLWVHADLLPGNLLTRQGRLSAVIDFGSVGLGDPASDVSVAWSLLPEGARRVFHNALGVDDATWARGRGLALSIALTALPYYQHTNPVFAGVARYTIAQVLTDHKRGA